MTLALVEAEKSIKNAAAQKNKVNYFLAVLTGILLFLSFPKTNLSFLAWIAIIPLLFSIQKVKPLKAFFIGLISGIVFYCGYLYWLVPTFIASGESWFLGLLILLLISVYLALYIASFCFVVKYFEFTGIVYSVFCASLWVFLEYLRGHFFSGIPGGILGYTQWNFLPIIQISDIAGVYGVSFLIVLVNAALFKSVKSVNFKSQVSSFIFISTVFAACLIYGFFKLSNTPKPLSQVKISVLQGNIDQYKKWDQRFANEIIDIYDKLAKDTAKLEKPDLIVWPEAAIPGFLLEEKYFSKWIYTLANETKTYHLIGSADFKDGKYFNSAIFASPEGEALAKYDKIHLVPFGETIPLKSFLSKYIRVVNSLGDFSSGKNYTVFELPIFGNSKPVKFSSNICFEAIFPEVVRKFKGQEFIINLTNDAWYLKTSAPYEHFTFNIFRAIENRKPIIRCANTGISGSIDSCGRIISQTKIFTTTAQTYTIQPNQTLTFYSRFSDIFTLLCAMYCIFYGLIFRKVI
ncbi:MAG: apolipoprotein N-acyltransferase [Elusimicrobia bacterium RIFOXYA2_FULL_40_6]|nr:MAG: apolipoprotein N-acyltransferase [Elusimicrobia bacterium RIFOXYA2_FULL_40_6]